MGAMENWGLVTFRETAVLVDPKNTSAKTKQWVSNHSFKRWGYQPQNFISEENNYAGYGKPGEGAEHTLHYTIILMVFGEL